MCQQCAKNMEDLVELSKNWHDSLQTLKQQLYKQSFPIVNMVVSKPSGTVISLEDAGGGHRQSFTLASLTYIQFIVSSPATYSIDTIKGPLTGTVNPGSPPLINAGSERIGLLFRSTDNIYLSQGSSGAIGLVVFGIEMPNHDLLW